MRTIQLLASTLSFILLLGGCSTVNVSNPLSSSAGSKAGQSTGKSVDRVIKVFEQAESDIDGVIVALNDLVDNPQPDLRKQGKAFNKSFDKFKKTSEKMDNLASKLSERAQTYFPEWEQQIAALENNRLRRNFEKRRDRLMKQYDRAMENYQDVKSQFGPLNSNLNDIYIALSTDLTSAGLKSIGSSVKQANRNAEKLKSPLTDLKLQFIELKNEFEPSMNPTDS